MNQMNKRLWAYDVMHYVRAMEDWCLFNDSEVFDHYMALKSRLVDIMGDDFDLAVVPYAEHNGCIEHGCPTVL